MKPTLLKLLISCNLLLAVCALSMGVFAYRQQTFHNAQLALFQQMTHNLSGTLDCPDWGQQAPFLAPEHPSQLEDLGQRPMAFLTACRAFRENPADQQLQRTLQRLAQQTDSLEELDMVLEAALDAREQSPEVTRELLRSMARIREVQLEDPEGAESCSSWTSCAAMPL